MAAEIDEDVDAVRRDAPGDGRVRLPLHIDEMVDDLLHELRICVVRPAERIREELER